MRLSSPLLRGGFPPSELFLLSALLIFQSGFVPVAKVLSLKNFSDLVILKVGVPVKVPKIAR